MKYLAIDLGTHTGWATLIDGDLDVGTLTLATPDETKAWRRANLDRRCDPRVRRLFEWARSWSSGWTVIFEDVEFCRNTGQCQLWSAFRSAIWCAFPPDQIESVPVHVIKQQATGNSKALKEDMAKAMARLKPNRFALDLRGPKGHIIYDLWNRCFLTDDAVDAFWILQWAIENVKR